MKKTIVTTSWDDGHTLDLKLAGLLKQYGIAGTLYVSPRSRELSEVSLLSLEEVRLLSHDFEIGAHTMTHPHLTKVDENTAKQEIADSKRVIEGCIGKPVVSFCYPAGYFTRRDIALVRALGFTYARTVKRFSFAKADEPLASPTTVHAYQHWSDVFSILRHGGARAFVKNYLNWDELAISLFEKAHQKGGIFHLWGHSWEIEAKDDWKRLERVLAYIGGRSDVTYLTNGELEP